MDDTVTRLAPYRDRRGNEIVLTGPDDARLGGSDGTPASGRPVTPDAYVKIVFTGDRNRLVVHRHALLADLVVEFNCSDGFVEIGPSSGVPPLRTNIRVGQDARVIIGRDVSSTSRVGISAVEGASVVVGDDVMFAAQTQLRSDDAHPIFDVRTGRRVNVARDVRVGDHVWVGWGAVLLGGADIGEGCVVGMQSLVTGRFANNCILAGAPARTVRRDVAWERPHLSLVPPFYKPDASTVTRSPYWRLTQDQVPGPAVRVAGVLRRATGGRVARAVVRRVRAQVRRVGRGGAGTGAGAGAGAGAGRTALVPSRPLRIVLPDTDEARAATTSVPDDLVGWDAHGGHDWDPAQPRP